MSKPLFEECIGNPVGAITDWDEHEILIVGVHAKYTFNASPVFGLIEIQQPDDSREIEQWKEDGDFRDNLTNMRVQTDAKGARDLAALLLKAAEVAESIDDENA